MAVATNSLITLTTLKNHLGITATTDDTILEAAIDRASAFVQRYTNRNFVSQRYYEWKDTYGADRVVVKHNPLSNIRFVGVGGDNVLSVTSTVSTDCAVTISVNDVHVHLFRVSSTGQETSTTITFASHDTTQELATQISAATGFSATALLNVKSQYLRKLAGRDLKNQSVLLEAPTEGLEDYSVDYDRGIIYGATLRRYQGFLIDYTGGYDSIPYDLQQATIELASRSYLGRKRDPGLASESLGGYSYSQRSVSELDAATKSLLDNYRKLR